MPLKTFHFVSPSFTDAKLHDPSFADLVDVYDDRTKYWLIEPAKTLLTPTGLIAAFALSLGYFEGSEIYRSGKDSSGKSKKFFRSAFMRVFRTIPEAQHIHGKMADALYDQARCGFFHDGLFRNRVFFSDSRPEPVAFTLPRKNGVFDFSAPIESIMVNPARFLAGVEVDHERYVAQLRSGLHPSLEHSFRAAVELRWGLEEPERTVGMSESEFHGGA